jgi:hypothetical protein
MAMIEAYRATLRSAASAANVPLLRRDDLMRQWSEEGTLNLAARDPAERDLVARHLFACVAHSLAGPIAAAVRRGWGCCPILADTGKRDDRRRR